MKKIFLDSLNKCGTDLDTFISRFMSIKENIGNGVGAGKLFESLFSNYINSKIDNIYSIHMNLSNSSFIWDIIITDDKDVISKREIIISIIKNGSNIEENITKVIGDNWIGISLKTYKEDACQITTDYSYRTYLEEKVGEGSISGDNVNEFFGLLNKHDKERYIILALNTYNKIGAHKAEVEKTTETLTKLENSKTITKKIADNITLLKVKLKELQSQTVLNKYTFRLLSFDQKFDEIKYKKNQKLSQYDISIGSNTYFKVLYGKNQANAFQRGIWTHNNDSINYFTLIKSGNFMESNYFEETILSTIFN